MLYTLRPSSKLHLEIASITRREKIICAAVMTILIVAVVLPMAWNPNWSGELHKHHNQYQLLADAFLKGQLYLEEPVDPRLAAMENPYDPKARDELNLDENSGGWDHAFYKGHYYVYFGAVPAILIFAPYKLIVGKSLATYHATQIFAALFIIGLFALFLFLAKMEPEAAAQWRLPRCIARRHLRGCAWKFGACIFLLAPLGLTIHAENFLRKFLSEHCWGLWHSLASRQSLWQIF